MTKRTRTFLFILCVFLFVLAAPAIVLYSQGYRLDFNPTGNGKRVVQTGAFYFKVLPKGAEVYLNRELKEKTSGLTGSILIKNLLPKTYEIEIKKAGYYPWQKSLEVKEKQVTEAKNIVLIPKNPNFTPTDQKLPGIETSTTSSDKIKLVEVNDYEIWILFLKEQFEQPQRKAGEKVFLTRFSEKIDRVFWLNNDYLIFNVGNKIKVAEIDDRNRINLIDLAEFQNPKLIWDEKDKKLYVLSEGRLYISEKLLP